MITNVLGIEMIEMNLCNLIWVAGLCICYIVLNRTIGETLSETFKTTETYRKVNKHPFKVFAVFVCFVVVVCFVFIR